MTMWGFELWATVLVFARLSAMVMLMPGVGDPMTPVTARLSLALMLAVLIRPETPPIPADIAAAGGMVISEVAIGLMFGAVGRILMSALATAGQIFGVETGLSFAQTVDPTVNQSGQIIGVFLSLMGVTLIFVVDLHHQILRGMFVSYSVFEAGRLPSLSDAADLSLTAFSDAFRIGLQIAAPVVAAGFVFRVGLGILSRLIPSIQVFFVAMPLNIIGGFLILILGLSAGMLVWLERMETFAVGFE
jgi:flagellar biosynthetic protein FliR